ncbi:MAG: L-threonylcarbamoyladenylate synthase [Desulfobulbaceae bacterium]|nr:L-threonylcarbamoyladenylate synthase [Desulfobulbaceae bacterium]
MRILQINPINPQQRLIDQVVVSLKQGAVISYPTDTMYGIGCDIFNQKAVKRIYQIKKRDKSKPFSFICSSLKDVSQYCFISNSAYRLMKKCLPGPYTFILPAMKIVPKIMMSKQKTVGIRVPENKICQQIVNSLGNPILTTSATLEEDFYLSEAFEVEERLGNQIDIIIDGEPITPAPSSVISLIDEEALVIRAGKGDISDFL